MNYKRSKKKKKLARSYRHACAGRKRVGTGRYRQIQKQIERSEGAQRESESESEDLPIMPTNRPHRKYYRIIENVSQRNPY
jgi:hypothetical protein